MTKKTKFRILQAVAGIGAGFLFTISLAAGVAAAETPDTGSGGASIGSIGTGSGGAPIDPVGTGSGGAKIDPIGTGSPDYSKPEPKPSRGDYDSPEAYGTAVSLWEAGERAREANLAASKGQDGDNETCSTIKTSPNYCYK